MDRKRRDLRHEVLGFVHRFVQENGFAPTCDEIRRAVDLSSRSHASYYLGILEREGHIQRTPRSPRGLRLLQECGENATRQSFDAWSPAAIQRSSRYSDFSDPRPACLQPLPRGKGDEYDG
jgi:SOS-response transcriptional repressor LexA